MTESKDAGNSEASSNETSKSVSNLLSKTTGARVHDETVTSKIGTGGGHFLNVVDLSYRIKTKGTDTKENQEKTLIYPVSFQVKPTEMVAIMGASGAGKSTLLDVLAQRVPSSQVDGLYHLDDSPIRPKEFKLMSGYVMQDDALYPLLTVRETLRFAAELRIPNYSKAVKYQVVEETIQQLKLQSCADTRVGNELHRGISGGERRRLSIGVDTVQQPRIIFLDEPTSGLDSTTALTVVETLSELCKRNRTVALTIHQPSTNVLNVFDKVMFLSKGMLVYHGRPNELPEYCNTHLKRTPPAYSNIAEFFLEIVDGHEGSGSVEALADQFQQNLRQRAPSLTGDDKSADGMQMTYEFANSPIAETYILVRRQWLNVLRTPELALVRIMMASVVSVVVGTLFWQTDNDLEGLRARVSYFAFAIALLLFTSLEALPIFLNERAIYTREHSRGAYRVVSYVVANFLVYLPVCFMMAVVFTSISYFMIDLPPSGFIVQILAIFMVLLQGNAFATAVSAATPDALTGNSAGTALLAFMFLFSGFFIAFDSIPKGWQWFSYLSMFKYPLEGMLLNMLDEEEERDSTTDADIAVLDSYAEEMSVQDSDKWALVYAPICFIIGFRFLFFLALVTKHSGSRK